MGEEPNRLARPVLSIGRKRGDAEGNWRLCTFITSRGFLSNTIMHISFLSVCQDYVVRQMSLVVRERRVD